MTRPPAPVLIWGGAIGSLVAYDIWCALNNIKGDSLSEVFRLVFRTHTPVGRMAFRVLIGGGGAWLVNHIVTEVLEDDET